jgi:hypothetical protein
VLSVDGKEVVSKTIPHIIPFVETIETRPSMSGWPKQGD